MTLVLTRVDYMSVGVTSRGTTVVLPLSDEKATQRVAVGDHDGILHIFCIKKTDLQIVFKSLPGHKIRRVVLAGTSSDEKDKIFIAYNNSVKGFTKKGKMFLEFDTNLMDSITSLYVLGADLAVCARDIYHRYRNCKDADSLLVGELINDVILLPSENRDSVIAILACGDRAIRILNKANSSPIVLRLPSVPTVFSMYRENGQEMNDRVLVGTQDGKIGLVIIHGTKTIRNTWLINTNGSEITCLNTYEMDNLTTTVDVIVGRQDGTVEIYNFSTINEIILPVLRYQYSAGESITSVNGGVISTPGYTEILVTTYSGKIFGLTTVSSGALEVGLNSKDADMVKRLEAEIAELELKVNESKDYDTYSSTAADYVLSPSILCVNYRMTLNRETATYSLSVELDSPIDNILIQSDTPIELLDESNNAVLSLSPTNPAVDGSYILATYRCQADTNQLGTKIKTIEGQPGTLQVFVTCQIQPKFCRRVKIPILALSLHTRIYDDDVNDSESTSDGPCNELKVTGGFTVAEMHAWLSLALPEMSERPNLKDNEVKLNYLSTSVGSILRCQYRKGSASFLSKNISTILILRDLITKEATKRKIKLDVNCNIEERSITSMLELILPQLNTAYELKEQHELITALYDLEMTDNPTENLSTEWQEILKDEENIKSKYLKNPHAVQEISAIIIDLYADWKRAKGHQRLTDKTTKNQLDEAIESRELSKLLEVFLKEDVDEAEITHQRHDSLVNDDTTTSD